MVTTVTIGAAPLEQLLTEVFTAAGCSPAEASRIGHYLVGANLVGHDSHGVVRTLRYVEWLQTGVQVADQSLALVTDGGCFALVDGRFGFSTNAVKRFDHAGFASGFGPRDVDDLGLPAPVVHVLERRELLV